MSNLKETFNKTIIPQLQKELKIKNSLAVPHLVKVVVNSGIGRFSKDEKTIEAISQEMALITGQRPIITKARAAIASFKIRQGVPVGLKVTLRGARMYDFVEKLIKVVFPRIRDFQGLSIKSLDQNGNITIGFKDAGVFPEVRRQQKVEHNFGLEITIVTNAKTQNNALSLFKALGFIFKS